MKSLIELSNASFVERYQLAKSTSDIDVLNALAMDNCRDVRWVVAENPNATPAILEKLAEDERIIVRCAVARNSNATPAILEKLADDKDEDVREAALAALAGLEKQEIN